MGKNPGRIPGRSLWKPMHLHHHMDHGAAMEGSGLSEHQGAPTGLEKGGHRPQVPKPWASSALSQLPATDQLPNVGSVYPLALPGLQQRRGSPEHLTCDHLFLKPSLPGLPDTMCSFCSHPFPKPLPSWTPGHIPS